MINEKGILEFNLEDPVSNRAFKRASTATEAYLCIYNIQEYLRRTYKYGEKNTSLEEICEYINNTILDNINMDYLD